MFVCLFWLETCHFLKSSIIIIRWFRCLAGLSLFIWFMVLIIWSYDRLKDKQTNREKCLFSISSSSLPHTHKKHTTIYIHINHFFVVEDFYGWFAKKAGGGGNCHRFQYSVYTDELLFFVLFIDNVWEKKRDCSNWLIIIRKKTGKILLFSLLLLMFYSFDLNLFCCCCCVCDYLFWIVRIEQQQQQNKIKTSSSD